ncbi:hypothetical protein H4219_001294 [Mycoemilia scoparia]|uniref:Uncharacterized protein n=1 Tax=Mycoemilia scoparia TaxID=417184 RepID=A0A9W8A0T2_9FUNG|nr:hypothetical protein H4219_001294 [Mycoemilia scoparia]
MLDTPARYGWTLQLNSPRKRISLSSALSLLVTYLAHYLLPKSYFPYTTPMPETSAWAPFALGAPPSFYKAQHIYDFIGPNEKFVKGIVPIPTGPHPNTCLPKDKKT